VERHIEPAGIFEEKKYGKKIFLLLYSRKFLFCLCNIFFVAVNRHLLLDRGKKNFVGL
jgi:hypothetical protein